MIWLFIFLSSIRCFLDCRTAHKKKEQIPPLLSLFSYHSRRIYTCVFLWATAESEREEKNRSIIFVLRTFFNVNKIYGMDFESLLRSKAEDVYAAQEIRR